MGHELAGIPWFLELEPVTFVPAKRAATQSRIRRGSDAFIAMSRYMPGDNRASLATRRNR
jgi:hypothetical protein